MKMMGQKINGTTLFIRIEIVNTNALRAENSVPKLHNANVRVVACRHVWFSQYFQLHCPVTFYPQRMESDQT